MLHLAATAALTLALSISAAHAQKKYDPGASDTEIKVGQTMPFSGPASAYSSIGKTQAAYFRMINDAGGIHGRKIKFISYDDGYSPAKTVEQTRKLVEDDQVLLVFGSVGTGSNAAVRKYMNEKQVPQLFIASGASKWNDPKNYPWTMGWQPSYQDEARVYAKYIMKHKADAKVGVLYQNDDFGKDYLNGLHDGLGDQAKKLIIVESSYETSSPTVDSQIVQIKGANPDIFVNIATPKFAAQAIKKAAEIAWTPLQIVTNVSASVGGVMQPAGFENSQGILSASYLKDGADPQWDKDPSMEKFLTFLKKDYPDANKLDGANAYGYAAAQTLVKVLEMCGDDLTRANVMKQAASLKDFVPDTLLPGISINTSPTDFAPIKQLRLMRFKGEKWELFGDIISSNLSN